MCEIFCYSYIFFFASCLLPIFRFLTCAFFPPYINFFNFLRAFFVTLPFLHIGIFKVKVCICIFILCVRFVKTMRNLFNIYFLNVLMLCIFGVGFDRFFLLLIFLLKMIFFLLLRMVVLLWLN